MSRRFVLYSSLIATIYPAAPAEEVALVWGTPPIQFDPPELQAGWWRVSSVPPNGSLAADNFDASFYEGACTLQAQECALTMVGPGFGQTSNVLMEWGALMRMAMYESRPPRAVILDDIFHHFIGDGFDVHAATRSWACVFDPWASAGASNRGWFEPGGIPEAKRDVGKDGRPGGQSCAVSRVRAKELFESRRHDTPAGLHFVTTLLHQLLLRPSVDLRATLAEFRAAHGLGNGFGNGGGGGGGGAPGYVAIHLRGMDGGCARRFENGESVRDELVDLSASLRRPVEARDVCEMSTPYVEAVLAAHQAPPGARFVLCHDNSQATHAARLVERFNASVFTGFEGLRTKARNAVLVDMLLGVQAALFIGNPTSSFSRTVAAVRRVALGGDDARSNLVGEFIRNF